MRLPNELVGEEMYEIVSKANFAAYAHANQKRKDGVTPYIVHPGRVAALVMHYGATTLIANNLKLAICAAWLHDVIEDTNYEIDNVLGTTETMNWSGDWESLKSSILALTKNKSIPNRNDKLKDSLDRIINNAPPYTILVKICDRIDNYMDLNGFDDGFITKYSGETKILMDTLREPAYKNGFDNAFEGLVEVVEWVEEGWE